MDHEIWVMIDEFPQYSVSNYGRVRNDDTGRLVRPSYTTRGSHKVNLSIGRQQFTRSVSLLVANAFVPGRSHIFDTPIHLDGEITNDEAENLAWRPRWFAINYTRQFREYYPNKSYGPIQDIYDAEKTYQDVLQASIVNGLLFKEVFSSCLNGTPVFPTRQIFEWVKLE